MISNIDSQGKQRPVKGGGAGLLQSMFAPVDRFCSGGLFAEYRRFYVAINSRNTVNAEQASKRVMRKPTRR